MIGRVKLLLVNDLPLFDPDPANGDALTGRLELALQDAPSEITILSYEDFVSAWRKPLDVIETNAVLVGTRPNLLINRYQPSNVPTWTVWSEREHDSRGFTTNARLTAPDVRELAARNEPCVILEDIIMSGTTISRILEHLSALGVRCQAVYAVAGSTPSVLSLKQRWPAVEFYTHMALDFEPIVEGTAIFVRDLYFGNIGGRPFLERTDLLDRFFGRALPAIARLRPCILEI